VKAHSLDPLRPERSAENGDGGHCAAYGEFGNITPRNGADTRAAVAPTPPTHFFGDRGA